MPARSAGIAALRKTDTGKRIDGFGLTVKPADDGRGLMITQVESGSIAAERGMSVGDIITAVNNTDIHSAEDLIEAVEAAVDAGRKAVLFQLGSRNGNRFVALPFEIG